MNREIWKQINKKQQKFNIFQIQFVLIEIFAKNMQNLKQNTTALSIVLSTNAPRVLKKGQFFIFYKNEIEGIY